MPHLAPRTEPPDGVRGFDAVVPFVAMGASVVAAAAGWLMTAWAYSVGGVLFEPGAPERVFDAMPDASVLVRSHVRELATPFFVVAAVHAVAGLVSRWALAGGVRARLVWSSTLFAWLVVLLASIPVGLAGALSFAVVALGPLVVVWLLAFVLHELRHMQPRRPPEPTP